VALWYLRSDRVRAAAERDVVAAPFRSIDGAAPPVPSRPAPSVTVGDAVAVGDDDAWALRRDDEADAPTDPVVGLDAGAVWTAAPRDVGALRRSAPPLAMAWSDALRTVSLDLVARGYEVDAFLGGAYRWVPRQRSAM
jgi:hypothetical protein